MQKVVVLAAAVALAASGYACSNTPVSPSGDVVSTSAASLSSQPNATAEGSKKGGGSTSGGGGKGGGKNGGSTTSGSGSLSVVMVTDQNGDGLPNWGDSITFNVSTTATTEPNVGLTCSQNGAIVYSAATGYYASYPWPWTQTMTLSSTMWQGGAASCTANLYYISGTSTIDITSINFTAGA